LPFQQGRSFDLDNRGVDFIIVGKIDGKIQINCFDAVFSSNLNRVAEAEKLYEELIKNRFVDPVEY
jgi:hypothetical protein